MANPAHVSEFAEPSAAELRRLREVSVRSRQSSGGKGSTRRKRVRRLRKRAVAAMLMVFTGCAFYGGSLGSHPVPVTAPAPGTILWQCPAAAVPALAAFSPQIAGWMEAAGVNPKQLPADSLLLGAVSELSVDGAAVATCQGSLQHTIDDLEESIAEAGDYPDALKSTGQCPEGGLYSYQKDGDDYTLSCPRHGLTYSSLEGFQAAVAASGPAPSAACLKSQAPRPWWDPRGWWQGAPRPEALGSSAYTWPRDWLGADPDEFRLSVSSDVLVAYLPSWAGSLKGVLVSGSHLGVAGNLQTRSGLVRLYSKQAEVAPTEAQGDCLELLARLPADSNLVAVCEPSALPAASLARVSGPLRDPLRSLCRVREGQLGLALDLDWNRDLPSELARACEGRTSGLVVATGAALPEPGLEDVAGGQQLSFGRELGEATGQPLHLDRLPGKPLAAGRCRNLPVGTHSVAVLWAAGQDPQGWWLSFTWQPEDPLPAAEKITTERPEVECVYRLHSSVVAGR